MTEITHTPNVPNKAYGPYKGARQLARIERQRIAAAMRGDNRPKDVPIVKVAWLDRPIPE